MTNTDFVSNADMSSRKITESENACPYCGFANPDEATFCVKCGTPLIFKTN